MVTPSQRDSVEPPLDFTGNVFNHLVKASQKRSSSELISLQSVFLSTCWLNYLEGKIVKLWTLFKSSSLITFSPSLFSLSFTNLKHIYSVLLLLCLFEERRFISFLKLTCSFCPVCHSQANFAWEYQVQLFHWTIGTNSDTLLVNCHKIITVWSFYDVICTDRTTVHSLLVAATTFS